MASTKNGLKLMVNGWRRGKRVKTPVVLQMEAVECGAAALGSVLGYFGRFVPLEKLREECGVSRNGATMGNVARAARRYGMIAKGYRKEPEALANFPLPAILYWNFNHFVVLEGIRGRKVFLNDPAVGHKTVTEKELDEAFTGMVLSIRPGPEFQPGGIRPSLYRALRVRSKGLGTSLLFALLAGLALVVPGMTVPVFSKIFVDDLLVGQMTGWLGPLLFGMLAVLLVYTMLAWLQQNTLLRQHVKLAVSSSAGFFHHVLRLPYVFFTQRYAGEIGSRMLSNDRVAMLLSGELASTVLKVVTICLFSVLMFLIDRVLTLVSVSIAVFNVAALTWISRRRIDLNQRVLQEQGKLMGVSMGGLNLIETIKATGSEPDFFARWSGYQARVTDAQQELSWWNNILMPLPLFLNVVNAAVVLGVGGMRIMEGRMTMGMLLAFQGLLISFMNPVIQLVNLGASFQQAVGDMNRLDDVFNYPQDKRYAVAEGSIVMAGNKVKLSGHLEIRGLTFGYSRLEPPLIENLSLTVARGARVALVGASGSGKSTIARLVCGLFEPWEGQILFDGQPGTAIPRVVMADSLAFVDQEIFLFEGRVRDNLTLWNPAVPDAEMVRAAKDACIHSDVAARTDGYDSLIEEGGRNLSGGQRQRMEIARALVSSPSLLILDEATSALDPETERRIDVNLRRRGCTCLIIAHRLSTIRDCDEIIVMEKGKVVQRGVHEDLFRTDGRYKWLIES